MFRASIIACGAMAAICLIAAPSWAQWNVTTFDDAGAGLGQINNPDEAEGLVNMPGQIASGPTGFDVINFHDSGNQGQFTGATQVAYPGVSGDDFATLIEGFVSLPGGFGTSVATNIGVNSDDGFTLRHNGVFLDDAGPRGVPNDDSIWNGVTLRHGDFLRIVQFERGSGASVEVLVDGDGNIGTSGDLELLGSAASGIDVVGSNLIPGLERTVTEEAPQLVGMEDFDGGGVGFSATNTFNSGAGDTTESFFGVTDSARTNLDLNGFDGNAFGGSDIDSGPAGGDSTAYVLTLDPINVAGFSDLTLAVDVAFEDEGESEPEDFLAINAVGRDAGNNILFDAMVDHIFALDDGEGGNGNYEDFGPFSDHGELTDDFTTLLFALPDASEVSGLETLDLEFTMFQTTDGEAFAIDNIRVTGQVPEPASIAMWSLMGLGLAGFGFCRYRHRES